MAEQYDTRDDNLDRLLVGEYRRLEESITEQLYRGGQLEPFRPLELRLFLISTITVMIAVSVHGCTDEEREAEAHRFFEFATFEIFRQTGAEDDFEYLTKIEESFAHRHSIYGDNVYQWVINDNLEAGLQVLTDLDFYVQESERSWLDRPAAIRALQNTIVESGRVMHAAYRAYPLRSAV